MTQATSSVRLGQAVPELPVTDVETAQRHYRDALGFEIGWLQPNKDIGSVHRGNATLFFRRHAPAAVPVAIWVFSEDIDALYKEILGSGAKITDPLEKKPWGLRQFTVEDIYRNKLYFHCD